MQPITEPFEPATVEDDPLDIVVPYTTPELTRVALRKAAELSLDVPSRIRILRTQQVPYPLQLQQPPVAVEVLQTQTQELARGLRAAEINIVLTRNARQTLLDNLQPGSIVVIASRKRPWQTRQERLKRFCENNGRRVAFVYGN